MMNQFVDKEYVKNPSSGAKKSHIFQYEGLVVEVIPESDLISSLTLF